MALYLKLPPSLRMLTSNGTTSYPSPPVNVSERATVKATGLSKGIAGPVIFENTCQEVLQHFIYRSNVTCTHLVLLGMRCVSPDPYF